jgi:hypothetical protein
MLVEKEFGIAPEDNRKRKYDDPAIKVAGKKKVPNKA